MGGGRRHHFHFIVFYLVYTLPFFLKDKFMGTSLAVQLSDS